MDISLTPRERELAELRLTVETAAAEARSWRNFGRRLLSTTGTVSALYLALWGCGVDPVVAARTVAGLWAVALVAQAIGIGALLLFSVTAVAVLGGSDGK